MLDRLSSPMSERTASRYIESILSAVGYMHSLNIVHCSLKPSNIAFSGSGELKIIGFGESKKLNDHKMYMFELKQADILDIGSMSFLFVCGHRRDESSKKLLFPKQVFLSAACKDFVRGLLAEDIMERLCAFEALQHRWICWSASPSLSASTPYQLDLSEILSPLGSEAEALDINDILDEVERKEMEFERLPSMETISLDEEEDGEDDGHILDVMTYDDLMSDVEVNEVAL